MRTVTGNLAVAATLAAVFLFATTPGAGLTNTITGKLTDAGCVAVLVLIMGGLATLWPVAVKVDREGRWNA